MDDSIDREIVEAGTIHWNVDDLIVAMDKVTRLSETPHDDWDRSPRGLVYEDPEGQVRGLYLNPDRMENQISMWLADYLDGQGLSMTEKVSHIWRFVEARWFLAHHGDRLRSEGLVRAAPDAPGREDLSSAVLEVLATATYNGVRAVGPNDDPIRTFHPEEVIREAKKIQSSWEDGPPDTV